VTGILFDDELTTIIHGKWQDHLDIIAEANVLITDPPYGMQYVSNSSKLGPTAPVRGDQDTDERDGLLEEWYAQGNRPAIVFGTWRVPRPAFPVRQLLVWHKGDSPGMGDLTLPWGPSHEEIYVMGGLGPEHWTGKRGPSVIRSRVSEGNAKGERDRHGHPTPKPVLLMQDIISHTTGSLILDPFLGSGTTCVAARLLGRRSVGIEMDRGYAEAAVERVKRIS